jgi:hypothetical protein
MKGLLLYLIVVGSPYIAAAQSCPPGTTPANWGNTKESGTGHGRNLFCQDSSGRVYATLASVNGEMAAAAFDGADVGAQVNAAIKALGPEGGGVQLPCGPSTYTTTIEINRANTTLRGCGGFSSDAVGQAATELTYRGGLRGIIVSKTGSTLRDFSLYCPDLPGVGILYRNGTGGTGVRLVNLRVWGSNRRGTGIQVGEAGAVGVYSFKFQDLYVSQFEVGLSLYANTHNAQIWGGSYDDNSTGIKIGTEGEGTGSNVQIIGSAIERNTVAGVEIVRADVVGISHFYSEFNPNTPSTARFLKVGTGARSPTVVTVEDGYIAVPPATEAVIELWRVQDLLVRGIYFTGAPTIACVKNNATGVSGIRLLENVYGKGGRPIDNMTGVVEINPDQTGKVYRTAALTDPRGQ